MASNPYGLIPGGQQPPRHMPQPPGQSYTPGPGQMMGRRGMGQQGGGVDGLKRQLAKLMSDMAMAQANGASPRHMAEIQGRIYQLELEIQIAQEHESGTADWLQTMMGNARSHSSRPYDPQGQGG